MALLRGKLVDERGTAVPNGTVYFLTGPVPLPGIAAQTSAAGEFALAVPAPGRYRLGARAAGFAGGEVEATVSTDADVYLELTLRREAAP